jgi:hypothetical protein
MIPALEIRRERTGEGGRYRRIKVLADDRVIAKLRPGAVATVDLPPGQYGLVAKMDWFTSEKIAVDLRSDTKLYTSMPFGQALAGFGKPATAITLWLEPA